MAYNGSGVYTPPASSFPAVTGTVIDSAKYNAVINDMSAALTGVITKDGQTTVTANLPMATYRHTGVSDGAALTDYTSVNQSVDGVLVYGGASAAGTDTYAVSLPISPGAYAAGNRYQFLADVANTGACTINFNGIGAKSIKMVDGSDPFTNAIQIGMVDVEYDGTNFVLLNPFFDFLNITGQVTATHTELNLMDGVTSTTAELNILDGVTSTAAELNILDGVTSVAADLNILSGADAAGLTAAELLYVNGVTSGVQTQIDSLVNLSLWSGLTLSNDTDTAHDINITAGLAADSAAASVLNLSSESTKQIDATWAAGDDAGGLFTGTVAINTQYGVFIIEKDSDGSIDAGFDTSATAANIPAGYTAYRRIGYVITDGSANILQFKQNGNDFELDTLVAELSAGVSASRALITLSVPPNTKAKLFAVMHDSATGAGSAWVRPTHATDVAPALGNSQLNWDGAGDGAASAEIEVWADSSSQIAYRTTTNDGVTISTSGWMDNREQ